MNIGTDAQFGTHPIIGLENPFVSSNRRVSLDDDPSRMERKRKVIFNFGDNIVWMPYTSNLRSDYSSKKCFGSCRLMRQE